MNEIEVSANPIVLPAAPVMTGRIPHGIISFQIFVYRLCVHPKKIKDIKIVYLD